MSGILQEELGTKARELVSSLCSKILKMPQTSAKYFPAHFFLGMRTESEQDWLH